MLFAKVEYADTESCDDGNSSMTEAESPTGQHDAYFADYTEEVNHYYADEAATSHQSGKTRNKLKHRVRRVLFFSLSLLFKYLFAK